MKSDRNIYQLLLSLRKTSNRSEKISLIRELISLPEGRYILQQAYDPFITYGIKPSKPNDAVDKKGLSFTIDVVDPFLKQLAARELTGNAAEIEYLNLVKTLNYEGQQILWHILSKDLKCGIAESTINEAEPGLIPVFQVMRAYPYEDKRIKKWPVSVEFKLDGQRTVFVCRKSKGVFLTRSGKSIPALDFMIQPLIKASREIARLNKTVADVIGQEDDLNFVLDGEAMMGLFEDTGVLRRIDEKALDAELHFFDILSYDEFNSKSNKTPLSDRRKILEQFIELGQKLLPSHEAKMLQIVPQFTAHNIDEIQDFFTIARSTSLAKYMSRSDLKREKELENELIDKATQKPKVLEGLIVKISASPYEKKKSVNWLKVKAKETEDLRVVDAFPGDQHTKYENCLGGLIVSREGVLVRVGGGFTDAERETIWKLYQLDQQATSEKQLIGRLIEVEFHEVTPDGSLRHPRFIRFRDDKDGEVTDEAA